MAGKPDLSIREMANSLLAKEIASGSTVIGSGGATETTDMSPVDNTVKRTLESAVDKVVSSIDRIKNVEDTASMALKESLPDGLLLVGTGVLENVVGTVVSSVGRPKKVLGTIPSKELMAPRVLSIDGAAKDALVSVVDTVVSSSSVDQPKKGEDMAATTIPDRFSVNNTVKDALDSVVDAVVLSVNQPERAGGSVEVGNEELMNPTDLPIICAVGDALGNTVDTGMSSIGQPKSIGDVSAMTSKECKNSELSVEGTIEHVLGSVVDKVVSFADQPERAESESPTASKELMGSRTLVVDSAVKAALGSVVESVFLSMNQSEKVCCTTAMENKELTVPLGSSLVDTVENTLRGVVDTVVSSTDQPKMIGNVGAMASDKHEISEGFLIENTVKGVLESADKSVPFSDQPECAGGTGATIRKDSVVLKNLAADDSVNGALAIVVGTDVLSIGQPERIRETKETASDELTTSMSLSVDETVRSALGGIVDTVVSTMDQTEKVEGTTAMANKVLMAAVNSSVVDTVKHALESVVDIVASSADQPEMAKGSSPMAIKEWRVPECLSEDNTIKSTLKSVVDTVVPSFDLSKRHGSSDHSTKETFTAKITPRNFLDFVVSPIVVDKDPAVIDFPVPSPIRTQNVELLATSKSDKQESFDASHDTGSLNLAQNPTALFSRKDDSEGIDFSGSQSTSVAGLKSLSLRNVLEADDQQTVEFDKQGAVNAPVGLQDTLPSVANDSDLNNLTLCNSSLFPRYVSSLHPIDETSRSSEASCVSTPGIRNESRCSDANRKELNDDWYHQQLAIDKSGARGTCTVHKSSLNVSHTHLAPLESTSTTEAMSDAGNDQPEQNVMVPVRCDKVVEVSKVMFTANNASSRLESANLTTETIASYSNSVVKSEDDCDPNSTSPSCFKTSLPSVECHSMEFECEDRKSAEFCLFRTGDDEFSASVENKPVHASTSNHTMPYATLALAKSVQTEDTAIRNVPQPENLLDQNQNFAELSNPDADKESHMKDMEGNYSTKADDLDDFELTIENSYSVRENLNGERNNCDSPPAHAGIVQDGVDLTADFASNIHLMRVKENIDLPKKCHNNNLYVAGDFVDTLGFEVPLPVRQVMNSMIRDVEEESDSCSVVTSVINHMLFAVDVCHNHGGQHEEHLTDWYHQANFNVLASRDEPAHVQVFSNNSTSEIESKQATDLEDMALARRMRLHSFKNLTNMNHVLRVIAVPSPTSKECSIDSDMLTTLMNTSEEWLINLKKNLLNSVKCFGKPGVNVAGVLGMDRKRRQGLAISDNASGKSCLPSAKHARLSSSRGGTVGYKNTDMLKRKLSAVSEVGKKCFQTSNLPIMDVMDQKTQTSAASEKAKISVMPVNTLPDVGPGITILKVKKPITTAGNEQQTVSRKAVQSHSQSKRKKCSATMKTSEEDVATIEHESNGEQKKGQTGEDEEADSPKGVYSHVKNSTERLRRCTLRNLVNDLWAVVPCKITHKPTKYVVLELARQCINKLKREVEKSGQLRRSLLVKKRLLKAKVQSLRHSRTPGYKPNKLRKYQKASDKPTLVKTGSVNDEQVVDNDRKSIKALEKPEASTSDSLQKRGKHRIVLSQLVSSASDSTVGQLPVVKTNENNGKTYQMVGINEGDGETRQSPMQSQMCKLKVNEHENVKLMPDNNSGANASAPLGDKPNLEKSVEKLKLKTYDLVRQTGMKRAVYPQTAINRLTSSVGTTLPTCKPNYKTVSNIPKVNTTISTNQTLATAITAFSRQTAHSSSLVNLHVCQTEISPTVASIAAPRLPKCNFHDQTLSDLKRSVSVNHHSQETTSTVSVGSALTATKASCTFVPSSNLKVDNSQGRSSNPDASMGNANAGCYRKLKNSPLVTEAGTMNRDHSKSHNISSNVSSIPLRPRTLLRIKAGSIYTLTTSHQIAPGNKHRIVNVEPVLSATPCSPAVSNLGNSQLSTSEITLSCDSLAQPNSNGIMPGEPTSSSKDQNFAVALSGRKAYVIPPHATNTVSVPSVSSAACKSADTPRASSQIQPTLNVPFGPANARAGSPVSSVNLPVPTASETCSRKSTSVHSAGTESISSHTLKFPVSNAQASQRVSTSLVDGYFVPVNVLFVPLNVVDDKGIVRDVLVAKPPPNAQLHSFRILNASKPCNVSLKTVRSSKSQSGTPHQSISYSNALNDPVGEVNTKLAGCKRSLRPHNASGKKRCARKTQQEEAEMPFKIAKLGKASVKKESSVQRPSKIIQAVNLACLDSGDEDISSPVSPVSCNSVSVDEELPPETELPVLEMRGNSLTTSMPMEDFVVPEIQNGPTLQRFMSKSSAGKGPKKAATGQNAMEVELVSLSDSESDDDIIIVSN